jgi:small subunit ribosomal protein S4e
MARKGGSTMVKRQAAPAFYAVPRKKLAFVTTIKAGPHGKAMSYDPITLLRDILKVVRSKKEAEYAIKLGKFLVDGVPRLSIHHPVGLMDVVELGTGGNVYRMLPQKGRLVAPISMASDEKGKKLCQVRSKVTISRNRIQLGTHDGRTFLVDDGSKYALGDALLVELPSNKILDTVPMKKGSLGLVVRGTKLGFVGEIKEVSKGSYSVEPNVNILIGDEEVVLPRGFVIPVGIKAPLVSIPRRAE